MDLPAPRDALFLIASCLAVAVAAFSAGRFTAPLQVEERVEYSELERKSERRKTKKRRAVDTIITVTPIALPTPDGGVLLASKTVTETRERTEESIDLKAAALRQAIGQTVTTTTNQPDWRFGVLGGARFGATGATGLAGGIVERRILGGVSLMGLGAVELDPAAAAPVVGGQALVGVSVEF